jgi:hypothetical protein
MIILWGILFYVLAFGVVLGIGMVYANLDELLVPAGCIAVVIGGLWLAIKGLMWLSTLVPAHIDEIGSQAFMLIVFGLMTLVWGCGAYLFVRWLIRGAVGSFQRHVGTARHS